MSGDPRPPGLIAAHFRISPECREPLSIGGLTGFPVQDERTPSRRLLAIRTETRAPARARFLASRPGFIVPNTMLPLDAGPGRDLAGAHGWFILCEGLPGPPVTNETQPWREQELVACVLKPVALALDALAGAGLTHRAIRPNNLFRAGPGNPVTIGPCWAAPPASLQPPVCEPPYSAWCLPAGRGDGCVADDVYALGVTLLALFQGKLPFAGVDGRAVLRRKLAAGSFAALTDGVPLPPLLSDLLRVMLAEDPEHRPSPSLLLNPVQACARRVSARPPRRAQRPLEIGETSVLSARELAYAIARNPERSCALLKNGTIDRWLRRFLGDAQTASRLDEIIHPRGGDALSPDAKDQAWMVMRAVVLLDPFAPLVWREVTIQPDGMGGAVAAAEGQQASALEEIVAKETVFQFAALSTRRIDLATLRNEVREWRDWQASGGPAGGMRRVAYALNPSMTCLSALLADGPAARLNELLPALEAGAARADRRRAPIDPDIAAFIAARADPSLAGDLASLQSFGDEHARMAVLRLFARLQARLHPAPLPNLSKWLADSDFAGLKHWRSRSAREVLAGKLEDAIREGQIPAMLAVVENPKGLEADAAASVRAAERIAWLEAALARIESEVALRAGRARQFGQEIATGLGLIATLGAAISLAVG